MDGYPLSKPKALSDIVCRSFISASDVFYGLFYLGLYNEARQENSKAAGYMKQALQTQYALTSNDYMVACAQVHSQRRGWA